MSLPSSMTVKEGPAKTQEARALLAAAVAAVLVEYHSQLVPRSAPDGPPSESTAWRMLACWERLQGSK